MIDDASTQEYWERRWAIGCLAPPYDLPAVAVSTLLNAGIRAPIGEWRFHKKRKWRLDLAWPDVKVAVEIHGGTWTHGRHTRGAGFAKDREKMNAAALAGWLVLEYTTEQMMEGTQIIEDVKRALKSRAP